MSRTPSVSRTASVSSTSSMSISSNTGKASSNASVSSGKTSPVKNGGTSTGMSKTTRSHVTRTASIKKPTEKSKDKEVAGPVAESSQAKIIKNQLLILCSAYVYVDLDFVKRLFGPREHVLDP